MAIRQPPGGQFFTPPFERPFDDKSDTKLLDVETSVVASLKKIMQSNARTSEEKLKVLEARDKLYKMMRDKDPFIKRGVLVATCPDMCPERERLLREYQGRGSIFEMTNFSKNSSFSHSLAVKEYARSSADQEEPLPHDLRPVKVLTVTMSHLLHNVVDYCELSDENLEEWYTFMWGRTRALRKELTQQRVCNLESVTLVEQCARFHIHCAERLIDQDISIYDDKINTENLTKCLQTLKYLYKDLGKEDVKCPNEPEFICYSLLLNLNNSSVFTELSSMPASLMTTEPVKFALDVMTTWETKNYIRFFKLVKKTTYLNCCLLRRYFGEMRLYAIKTMIRSYCTKTYSPQILISRFVEMLNFEREEECLNFLSYCHFNFHEVNGKTVVNFDRVLFQNPTSTMTSGRAFLFIEEKKRRPLSVIMAGGEMPPKLFESYVPHSSFTPNGDLNPDAEPQKKLLEFFKSSNSSKIDSSKSTSSIDIFTERERAEPMNSLKLPKEETASALSPKNPLPTSIFRVNQTPPFGFSSTNSTNIFGNNFTKPNTGSFGSIFNSQLGSDSVKNIFANQDSSSLFGNMKSVFRSEEKTFPTIPFPYGATQQGQIQSESNKLNLSSQFLKNKPSHLATPFQHVSDSNLEKPKLQEERERKEKLEREIILREKVEEEKRKREEEEKAKMLLEKRLREENERKEMERREREKREEEERQKKEQQARMEKEERDRREEAARQERLREAKAKELEELKRQEEIRRKIELEYKQKVDVKMCDLKSKMRKWKTKIIFDKWRMKTWTKVEEKKMNKYFQEVNVKYPPVCTEEMLDGNPYGLLIPNILTFEKFRDWKKQFVQEPSKKLLIVNDELPLLKINSILGKPLEDVARRVGTKLDPFPWKLVISVPDHLESPDSWKNIETFVEMHFVEHFQWQFGVQKGPLYCRGGSRGAFRYDISIRRLRGCELYEGSEPNSFATTGSNALMFFIAETGNEITCERLKSVLKSRSPLPKIPVVIIILNSKVNPESVRTLLKLEVFEKSHISEYFVNTVFDGKQPVIQLRKCLILAAIKSAAPSCLRVNLFSSFFSGFWIDSLWRRVEIGFSNFKINLQEPKVLIEFYNSCIEELADIFLDKSYNDITVLAEEFSECSVRPPARTSMYESRLRSVLDRLKLPQWPSETPKSCHQLNYRIHQYCKKVTGQNRSKIKNLKWGLYRIIRQSLSWKGLDIYCDEDIYVILTNFPWIQVFQEISRVVTRELCEEVRDTKEVIIVYNVERMEKFNFESSFIGKFLNKSKKRSSKNPAQLLEDGGEQEDLDELNPCLEKDSVVYAYSAAIERETNKRKREERVEESLDALFSSPAGKRLVLEEEETKGFDFSSIETSFQSLDERLNGMKKQMAENLKILTDIQSIMQ